jgi:hypothetical protein
MIDFLAGVPGKLATLLSRVPSNNATLVANLDTTVSSRAAASSAVSNVDYTSARAGYLDKLNAGGIAGTVKSVQTLSYTLASEASKVFTITSVSTTKTIIIPTSSSNSIAWTRWRLTSATQVTYDQTASTSEPIQAFVVEFY